jgi:hypothetical protein
MPCRVFQGQRGSAGGAQCARGETERNARLGDERCRLAARAWHGHGARHAGSDHKTGTHQRDTAVCLWCVTPLRLYVVSVWDVRGCQTTQTTEDGARDGFSR